MANARDYFRNSPVPSEADEENWPVLGMSFDVFRLVVIASRLVGFLSCRRRVRIAAVVLAELSSWYEVILQQVIHEWAFLPRGCQRSVRTLVASQPDGDLLDDKHQPDIEVAAVVSTIRNRSSVQ